MMEDSFPAHGMLSSVSKRCPDAVKWIIRRAMTDYDKRYTTADAMLADLRTVAAASDPFAVKPVDLPSMSGVALDPAAMPRPEPMQPEPIVSQGQSRQDLAVALRPELLQRLHRSAPAPRALGPAALARRPQGPTPARCKLVERARGG